MAQTPIAMNTSDDVQMTDGATVPNRADNEFYAIEFVYAERLAKIKWILSGEMAMKNLC